jgi:hypothetical protein
MPVKNTGGFWKRMALWINMSRIGDCFDNVVAGSFFGNLKQKQIISIFYYSHRLHSYLEYKSPNQYEIEAEMLKKVA